MIPNSADHDHVRRMYLDALAKHEHAEAQRTMRALVFVIFYAIAVLGLVAWIAWR